MPPVGGFVALCAAGGGACAPIKLKTGIISNFSKVECKPYSADINGVITMYYDCYRIIHGGIKIVFNGYLDFTERAGILYADKYYKLCSVTTVLSRKINIYLELFFSIYLYKVL